MYVLLCVDHFGGALKRKYSQLMDMPYMNSNMPFTVIWILDIILIKINFLNWKRFAVNPGDMIVSCSGTIGKTFVIPKNAPEGIINQALLKLTPNEELNVFYLQYF